MEPHNVHYPQKKPGQKSQLNYPNPAKGRFAIKPEPKRLSADVASLRQIKPKNLCKSVKSVDDFLAAQLRCGDTVEYQIDNLIQLPRE